MASRNKSSRSQEAHKQVLADLLKDLSNKTCADCRAKGPRWASWNLGVFVCIRCAGIHRNLGVHISRVKSVNLDTWTNEQIESISGLGNERANRVYECNLPNGFVRPVDDLSAETFIRAKYEHKKYCRRMSSPLADSHTKRASPVDKVKDRKVKESNPKTLAVPSGPRKVASAPVLADHKGNPVIRTAVATASPRSRPRGTQPLSASPQNPSVDLLAIDEPPLAQPYSPASLQPDTMTFQQSHAKKDSIMSLYSVQQQQQQYPGFVGYQQQAMGSPGMMVAGSTSQYPSMYQQQLQYQQQIHMQQQMHVQQVQEQMAKLKMQQHQPQVGQDSLLSDWPSSQPTEVSMAGQTMNNQLWQ